MTRCYPTPSEVRGAVLLLVAMFVFVFGSGFAYAVGVL